MHAHTTTDENGGTTTQLGPCGADAQDRALEPPHPEQTGVPRSAQLEASTRHVPPSVRFNPHTAPSPLGTFQARRAPSKREGSLLVHRGVPSFL